MDLVHCAKTEYMGGYFKLRVLVNGI